MVKDKLKILIVDEIEVNRNLLGEMIKDDYDVLQAKNGFQVIGMLNEYSDSLALILMDIMMPKKDVYEVLGEMKEKNLLNMIPVIVVTVFNRMESGFKALELGAADIICKPLEPKLLRKRIQNVISAHQYNRLSPVVKEKHRAVVDFENQEIMELTDQLKKYKEENQLLKQFSKLDPLTEVYNRNYIQELVTEYIEKKEAVKSGFMLVEFSNRDAISEKYGVGIGEKFLQIFGKVLKAHFGEEDLIGRVDSDCFLVFIKGIQDFSFLRQKAQSIITIMKNSEAELKGDDTISVGIGVAIFPQNGKRYEDLYSVAQKMLRSGKIEKTNQSKMNSFFMLEDDRVMDIIGSNEFFDKVQRVIKNDQAKKYLFIRIDMDGFQKYAEWNGYEAGEKLLTQVGLEMERFVKDRGICGKIYTATFGMCMEISEQEVGQFVKKLEVKLYGLDSNVGVTPYCGIYRIINTKMTSVEMCNNAGLACLKAKKIKRN